MGQLFHRNIYIGQMSHIYNMEKGPDIAKLRAIRDALLKHKNGLWIRELAKKAKLSKSTVSRYVNNYLKYEVKVEKVGPLKLIKLK